jgi:hypothetical protein
MAEDMMTQDPGTAPDLEAMSTDELGKHLDQTQSAPPDNGQDPAQEANGEMNSANQAGTPDPLSVLTKRIEEMHREQGRFRGLQSRLDGLDGSVEKAVARALEARERRNYENSLSPEERSASQQAEQRQNQFRDLVRQQAVEAMREQFPEQFDFIDRSMQERADQSFLGEVSTMAEGVMPGLSQGIAGMFQKNYEELNSQDPATVRQALEWNERSKNPSFLVLELIKAQSSKAKAGAQSFQQTKTREAASASAGIRSASASAAGAKSLGQHTQSELENMSLEQLEKLIPERA